MMNREISNRLVWLDGEMLDVNEAKIGILSPTAQYGLNVFEGIPCYLNEKEGKLYAFRLKDHYSRLCRSSKLLQIEPEYSVSDMESALKAIVKENEYFEDISVRQTLFVKDFGYWGSSVPVGMFVAPIPKRGMNKEYNKKGLDVCISSWRRISDNVLSPRIKCGANYINSRMAQREALRNGYDTCVLLNESGKIAEAPGSCMFLVKNGELVTPLLTDSVLESITRDTIIKLAGDLGIKVVERSIDRTELYSCDEAFLCGSAMEITPVLSVDKFAITEAAGEITDKLHTEYLRAARGQNEKYKDWVTSIYD